MPELLSLPTHQLSHYEALPCVQIYARLQFRSRPLLWGIPSSSHPFCSHREKITTTLLQLLGFLRLLRFLFFVPWMLDGQAPDVEMVTDGDDHIDDKTSINTDSHSQHEE